MTGLKRISMAGSDIAVTGAALADLVLEYAMHLGRVGTTDVVVLPVARHGRVEEASLLLGPASQIALMENDHVDLEQVELVGLAEAEADLRHRIARITGTADAPLPDDAGAPPPFLDLDGFGEHPGIDDRG